jgi:hypothetical protein
MVRILIGDPSAGSVALPFLGQGGDGCGTAAGPVETHPRPPTRRSGPSPTRATATTGSRTWAATLSVGVAQSSTSDGAAVIQWNDLKVDDQLWKIIRIKLAAFPLVDGFGTS